MCVIGWLCNHNYCVPLRALRNISLGKNKLYFFRVTSYNYVTFSKHSFFLFSSHPLAYATGTQERNGVSCNIDHDIYCLYLILFKHVCIKWIVIFGMLFDLETIHLYQFVKIYLNSETNVSEFKENLDEIFISLDVSVQDSINGNV